MNELDAERSWYAYVDGAVRLQVDADRAGRDAPTTAGADRFAENAIAEMRRRRAADAEAHSHDGEHYVGRIDDEAGEAIYVGRRLVRDVGGRPRSHEHVVDGIAVVNWQVPAAKPFYTARPGATHGVVLRRRFVLGDRTVESYSDEVLGTLPQPRASDEGKTDGRTAGRKAGRTAGRTELVPAPAPARAPRAARSRPTPPPVRSTRDTVPVEQAAASGPVMAGQVDDPLLAALARGREHTMRDIVATIQAEQYELMERPGTGVLVVQGAPGTGKTAVALHRLSMLLVRESRLERAGTLLVGPSPRFLEYVARVLPGLGSASVDQSTVLGLSGVAAVGPDESAEVARVKGDARMAAVLRAALDERIAVPDRPWTAQLGGERLRLSRSALHAIVDEVRQSPPRMASRRALVLSRVVAALSAQVIEAVGGAERVRYSAVPDPVAALTGLPAVQALVDQIAPVTGAVAVLTDLWSSSGALLRASTGVLGAPEVRALWDWVDDEWDREAPTRRRRVAWSTGDVPLLDELAALLGEDTGSRTWGHIAVDEAQDLTPMQLRMLGRRLAPGGGVTLLGDLAQATGPYEHSGWDEIASYALPGSPEPVVAELRLGYRVPARILQVANAILPHTGTGVAGGVAVRELPDALADLHVLPSENVLRVACDTAVRRAGSGLTLLVGSPEVLEAISADDRARCEHAGVTLLGPAEAKGLEFDHVVLVEPSHMVGSAGSPGLGARLLYVAVTRATSTLDVYRHEPMPFDATGGGVPTAAGQWHDGPPAPLVPRETVAAPVRQDTVATPIAQETVAAPSPQQGAGQPTPPRRTGWFGRRRG
ncbi:HelD family protein [Cellulomonas sp. URHB0016]